MMKRTKTTRHDTHAAALKAKNDVKSQQKGAEGKDWKVKILRRGKKRSHVGEYFEVITYVGQKTEYKPGPVPGDAKGNDSGDDAVSSESIGSEKKGPSHRGGKQ
jgi:hypothetical protein